MMYARLSQHVSFISHELAETAKIACPILISLSLSMLSGLVDTVALGRFSTQALSSAVVGTSIFIVFVTAVNGLLRSMIPLYFSASDSRESARVVFNSGALALGLSAFFCAVVLNLKSVLFIWGFEDTLSQHTYNYLGILIWGLIPLSLSMVVTNLFIVRKYTKPLLKVSALAFLVNVSTTIILVFGLTGGEPMGERGAAVGSVLSYLFSFAYGGLLYARKYKGVAPILVPEFCFSLIKQCFVIGVPISAAVVTKFTAMSMLAIWVSQAGDKHVGAFGILNNVATIVFIFPVAYGQAQLSRLGHTGKFETAGAGLRWLYACLLNIALITTLVVLTLFAIQDWLIGVYTSDDSIVALFQRTLPIMLIVVMFDAIQATSGIVLTHFKDTLFSFASIAIGYFLICLPVVYFFSDVTSPDIILHVYKAMMLCMLILTVLQVGRLSKRIVRE
ncbi:MATE family efflux transporter [Vibrio alginolyticus]|uniref:Multidrug resistance protein NorM n=1 Tax=Vibrio alginolyticus TaxID=663 RepID=A0A7Y4B6L2_VIBAL|nr:MATE family efflux transporter [Vibrio alginolyticus]NOI11647.1 hypothetical protein [Vibrio alginolyticus]